MKPRDPLGFIEAQQAAGVEQMAEALGRREPEVVTALRAHLGVVGEPALVEQPLAAGAPEPVAAVLLAPAGPARGSREPEVVTALRAHLGVVGEPALVEQPLAAGAPEPVAAVLLAPAGPARGC